MINQEAYEAALDACGWEEESWKAYKLVEEYVKAYEQAKLGKATTAPQMDTPIKDWTAYMIYNNTKNNPPYKVESDGRLSEIVEPPEVLDKVYPSLSINSLNLDKPKVGTGTCSADSGKLHPIPELVKVVGREIKLYPSESVEPPKVPEKLFVAENGYVSLSDAGTALNTLIDCVNYLMNKGER